MWRCYSDTRDIIIADAGMIWCGPLGSRLRRLDMLQLRTVPKCSTGDKPYLRSDVPCWREGCDGTGKTAFGDSIARRIRSSTSSVDIIDTTATPTGHPSLAAQFLRKLEFHFRPSWHLKQNEHPGGAPNRSAVVLIAEQCYWSESDPDSCGGISELVKVCTMALA
jgi:hypothetical protein